MTTRGHYPPSRLRYEKANPTVSTRVPQELYAQLTEMSEKTGKSIAYFLREAIREQTTSRKEKNAYKRGYKRGHDKGYQDAGKIRYDKGYRDAEERYRVDFTCSICGKPLAVNSPEAKEDAARMMSEAGWYHTTCANKTP